MSSEDAQAATEETNDDVETEEVEDAPQPQENSGEEVEDEPGKALKEGGNALPDDPDILKREIAKLRKENAAKRTKAKETEEAAKKWQEHVDSQKTELEKLQEKVSLLQTENQGYKLEKVQRDLAKEYGVDDDLVEFIVGNDLDEMTEKAKKLAAKTGQKKSTPTAADLRAGRTSGDVEMTGSKWLKELFK